MTVETQKTLYLTREERGVISRFYDILNDNKNLDTYDAWEVFTAVHDNDNERAEDYDYTIIIVD